MAAQRYPLLGNAGYYNCRVCGNEQPSDVVATLDSGYRIVRCRNCRVKASQPMPSDSELKNYYSHYHPDEEIPREQTIINLHAGGRSPGA